MGRKVDGMKRERTVDDVGVLFKTGLVVLLFFLGRVILPEGVVVLDAVLNASIGEGSVRHCVR
jgi:hypothetical protein